MKRKSNSYHLEIRTNRNKPIGLLRNSYREDGKVKKETICQFSGLSIEQLRLIKASLQGKAIIKEDFKILDSREFGASYAACSIAKELWLHKAIYSRYTEDWVKSAIAMIVGRLVFKGSKLSLSHCCSYSSLWEVCGITGPIDVKTNCYDPMDKLLERQEAIEEFLAKKHLTDGTLVLYDITSCYMEGEYENSELVAFGYNRDKKHGHEQIVISLLCSKEGCPIATEVFAGNTKDETTVINKINEIKQKYSLSKIIFVGDRGMILQTTFDKIDHQTVKVVSALSHGKIQELCDNDIIQLSLFDEQPTVEIISGDLRYMLCKNPIMEAKETATRRQLLDLTCAELDKIIASTRKTKNSKAVRAGKIVNKYKMAKFIIFDGADDDLSYKLDKDKIEKESALDGCYVVFTDVSKSDLSAKEAIETYKSLIQVEQAFRSLKTTQLEIRPVYHKTDNRIKCHVFICMLSYYIMWHMKQKLIPFFEANEAGAKRKYTFDYIIEILKSIRKESVSVSGVETYVLSTPNVEQNRILNMLGVAM
jgi:transposase